MRVALRTGFFFFLCWLDGEDWGVLFLWVWLGMDGWMGAFTLAGGLWLVTLESGIMVVFHEKYSSLLDCTSRLPAVLTAPSVVQQDPSHPGLL